VQGNAQVIWAVVPAKLGNEAKVRLGTILPASDRTRLAQAMLTDVLRALVETDRFAGIAVVSRDDLARRLAAEQGALVVDEPRAGDLNAAVAAGIEACVTRGATEVLVAMADLPLLAAPEVARLLDHLPADGAAAAISFDGTGTNLLAIRPPRALPTSFGPDSLVRHREAAAQRGLAFRAIPLPGAALDIDTPRDLERLVAADRIAPASLAMLREAGLVRVRDGAASP
jgi:2-phospho-L-lactate guanylyltransferase